MFRLIAHIRHMSRMNRETIRFLCLLCLFRFGRPMIYNRIRVSNDALGANVVIVCV